MFRRKAPVALTTYPSGSQNFGGRLPLTTGNITSLIIDVVDPTGIVWPNNYQPTLMDFVLHPIPVPGAGGMLAAVGLIGMAVGLRRRKMSVAEA